MKFINRIILIVSLSVILFSCAEMNVVNLENDKRIVTQVFKNGDVKTIYEKFYSSKGQWLEVECANKNKTVDECKNNRIIKTKLANLRYSKLSNDSSNNSSKPLDSKKESSRKKQVPSNNKEEESSDNEEESTDVDEEEDINEHEHPPLPPLPCEGGPDVC